jgi:sugar lactone lactonase YvrE
MNILLGLLMLSTLTSLMVPGLNLSPVQSYAVADGDGDNGDHKTTKDYKDYIHKDVNAGSERTNQHSSQENLCYRDDGCEQANNGQQIQGKDTAASGFNDPSKNVQQKQPASAISPVTPPPPQTGTLLVTKGVECVQGFTCPPPSDFTMRVTGAPGDGNPFPSSFTGSEGGTSVTLNVGAYNVLEEFQDSASSPLKVVKHFSADCSGNIQTAGESRVCNVTNEFLVKEYAFLSKFGSPGSLDGQLNQPWGIAVNPSTGNVYVADSLNNRIQVFDSSGAFVTKFGSRGSLDGQFFTPCGVAVNPSTGNVYVADTFNNRIQVFDNKGAFITKWGSRGSLDGQFSATPSVAVNPSTGNVYVVDIGNNRIQVFDSLGNFITKFGTEGSLDGQFNDATSVAVNPSTGNVYVADSFNGRIQVFDSSGAFVTKFGSPGSLDGQFDRPEGVAVNPSTGNVYVSDTSNNRIQVFFLDP